jgi:hypothetical protein
MAKQFTVHDALLKHSAEHARVLEHVRIKPGHALIGRLTKREPGGFTFEKEVSALTGEDVGNLVTHPALDEVVRPIGVFANVLGAYFPVTAENHIFLKKSSGNKFVFVFSSTGRPPVMALKGIIYGLRKKP